MDGVTKVPAGSGIAWSTNSAHNRPSADWWLCSMSIYCVYGNFVSVTYFERRAASPTLDGLPFFIATISLRCELDDRVERYVTVW